MVQEEKRKIGYFFFLFFFKFVLNKAMEMIDLTYLLMISIALFKTNLKKKRRKISYFSFFSSCTIGCTSSLSCS